MSECTLSTCTEFLCVTCTGFAAQNRYAYLGDSNKHIIDVRCQCLDRRQVFLAPEPDFELDTRNALPVLSGYRAFRDIDGLVKLSRKLSAWSKDADHTSLDRDGN